MSPWYGLGRNWIDVGLPNYTAMDRKPENSSEIHSSCCGRSKIILRHNFVKHLNDYTTDTEDADMSDKPPQGTKELVELVRPWLETKPAVYAQSVQSA